MTPEREACYDAGHAAGLAGAPNTDCPYLPVTDEAVDWLHGHRYGTSMTPYRISVE